jgi:hypothetical protein
MRTLKLQVKIQLKKHCKVPNKKRKFIYLSEDNWLLFFKNKKYAINSYAR